MTIQSAQMVAAGSKVASLSYPIKSIVSIKGGAMTCEVSLPATMLSDDCNNRLELIELTLSFLESTKIYVDAKKNSSDLEALPNTIILEEDLTFLLTYNDDTGYAYVTELPEAIKSLDENVQWLIMLESVQQLQDLESRYKFGTH